MGGAKQKSLVGGRGVKEHKRGAKVRGREGGNALNAKALVGESRPSKRQVREVIWGGPKRAER